MNAKCQPLLIFTDGACSGNPGSGGWAAIIVYPEGQVKELGGPQRIATNNEMELLAAAKALASIRQVPGPVSIYTDSTYLIRGITQWIWGWKKKKWITAEGKPVSNRDLWEEIFHLVSARSPKVEWHYVRGHSGVPGNERVDEIAVEFSQGRRVDLYSGPLLRYSVPIHDLPESTELPPMKEKSEKKVAYSYLSLVNGQLERHADWKTCEARVKGRSGAKFKKCESPEEETRILKEWGVAKVGVD